MAPHAIKENRFEMFAKKIQQWYNETFTEKFIDNLYIVIQVVIWVLISSLTTYYLIEINY